MPSELPRRTLLTGAGALAAAALTGCTGGGPGAAEEAREHAERAERSPAALRLRRRAARDSAALLERYDAVAAAHPHLAESLAPLRAAVAAQLAAVREDGTDTPPADAPPADAAGPPAAADGGGARAALDSLAAAERTVADGRLAALADAPPELARLLASMAAAGAVQERLLAGLGEQP